MSNSPPDLTAILEDARAGLGGSGILAAVLRHGVITTHSTESIPACDHARPFYIYSQTKTFTAAAILRLCEQQGDFLDEPLASLLPRAPAILPRAATVRQVLHHTAGLSDYGALPAYSAAVRARPGRPWPATELRRRGLARTPLFLPGRGWSYSNPGYALLNDLIAHRSGQAFWDAVRRLILEPLALRDTRPFLEPDREARLLPAREPAISGDFRARYAPGWILPGCLISTVADVARFYDALLAGRLLRPGTLAQMLTTVDVPFTLPGDGLPAYGLGLMHDRGDPLGPAYGHGGGGPGYTTYARSYLSLAGAPLTLSLVITTSLPATPFELATRIVRAVVEAETTPRACDPAREWPIP